MLLFPQPVRPVSFLPFTVFSGALLPPADLRYNKTASIQPGNYVMSRYLNFAFALRALYVVLGLFLLGYAITQSTARMILYAPAIFGILLLIQGFAGT
jgi:hypothetical protein